MGMAGPNADQWLAAVLRRVTINEKTDRITVDGDDWRNVVRLARQALGHDADYVDPPASGDWMVYRAAGYMRAEEREKWEAQRA